MSLDRFTDAQALIWPAPLDEIRAGRKRSHWMWYVFPQLCGLGRSPTAQHYGIKGLTEARAYLAHEVLGARLEEISAAMLTRRDIPARAILGPVDVLKLRSCMTLFRAADGARVFQDVLDAFYAGEHCAVTLGMIGEP